MKQNLVDLLKSLVDFTDEEIEITEELFEIKHIKKGEIWVREGDLKLEVAFINKGLMRIFFMKGKSENTFQFRAEGEFVSSFDNFFSQKPSRDYIQALEDCELCTISIQNLEYLRNKFHNWERFGRINYGSYFMEFDERIRAFISETAQQRYERFIRDYPDRTNRIPQLYLSNYLGITPQSLSRVRSRMSKKETVVKI
ncbi:cAMP-binding domain of CRP or a regulatory subunit of cAMP-dependent protein kinases [Pseudarcicella hirudinis]|uniref:cAMP-binding domain of CRP or a regulatory subunit of cAMP-dependent protein kinases n=1 Tax=Pseudarcicella hirudinis TaxID=1079859 RepID=A0A1I5X9H2_9BACT|nr:Crp/Fnr family transcriptional regulator [Pseudarcicella hirudinis]SFQ28620.1 cAMP-binding domain of CRP or a regulatory subunit of cAMP-dependent protein kinases [Pseudarcicella hirudinis]